MNNQKAGKRSKIYTIAFYTTFSLSISIGVAQVYVIKELISINNSVTTHISSEQQGGQSIVASQQEGNIQQGGEGAQIGGDKSQQFKKIAQMLLMNEPIIEGDQNISNIKAPNLDNLDLNTLRQLEELVDSLIRRKVR